MYLKIVARANMGYDYYYYNFGCIKVYDFNNNLIPLDHNNIISHTWTTRIGTENLNMIFSDISPEAEPYYSSLSNRSETIISFNQNNITKIETQSYGNTGGAKYLDLYYSYDSINYIFISTIEFSSPAETKSIDNIMLFPILIKSNNKYYTYNGEWVEVELTEENFGVYVDNLTSYIDNVSLPMEYVKDLDEGKLYRKTINKRRNIQQIEVI